MSDQTPKKRGPKPQYEHQKKYQSGAPLLTTRIHPDALDWVTSRPEGARPFLERIIFEDRDRSQVTQPPKESIDPNDVPGQLLLPGGESSS